VLIGVHEAARLLSVSERSIYRWVSMGVGVIPHYKVGGQYRFRPSDLLQWAAGRRPVPAPAESTDEDAGPLPSLVEALEVGGIHYRVAGADRESALRAALAVMPLPEDVDREAVLQRLIEREILCSTALGRGVAAPHSREAVSPSLRRTMVALCFLETPILFNSPDGQPVTALFLPFAVSIRVHLHLLSRLAFALRDEPMIGLLRAAAPREAILGRAGQVEAFLAATPRMSDATKGES
jgi:PTS system nitrogen regulatory IIA component